MTLKEQLQNNVKEALKARDENASLTLRSLLSEVQNRAIALKKQATGLSDEEIQEVVLRELKKRQEAAFEYRKGNREDLAAQEEREAMILQRYAPEQLTEAELRPIIGDIIKNVDAHSAKDLGRVMKEVMAKVKNQADGSLVSRLVREELEQ